MGLLRVKVFTMNPAEFTYFYFTPGDIKRDVITFNAEESRHISRVCRIGSGDQIMATDGNGRVCHVEITDPSRNAVMGKIVSSETHEKPSPSIELAIPLTSANKADWIIEKCTELGISSFHFFPSQRSKVAQNDKKLERLSRISISAIKQSMRAHVPAIIRHDTLESLTGSFSSFDVILLGHLDKAIPELPERRKTTGVKRVLLVVGPEAGFDPSEVKQIRDSGAETVRFGNHRLRMETAAIVLSTIAIQHFSAS